MGDVLRLEYRCRRCHTIVDGSAESFLSGGSADSIDG